MKNPRVAQEALKRLEVVETIHIERDGSGDYEALAQCSSDPGPRPTEPPELQTKFPTNLNPLEIIPHHKIFGKLFVDKTGLPAIRNC